MNAATNLLSTTGTFIASGWRVWQSITLWKRVLIGLIVGGVVGATMHYVDKSMGDQGGFATEVADAWFKPIGDGFIRLIMMLIMPLIATSIVAGVTAMDNPKKLGTIGIRALALYTVTTLLAVSLGLLSGTIIRPGAGVEYETAAQSDIEDIEGRIQTAEEAGGVADRILELIPANPIDALANGDVVPTILFAILIGIGILLAGERGAPVKTFFESAADVVMRVTRMVMELAPFGVCALIAWVMATRGFDVVTSLFWLAFALYLTCFVQIIFVYGGLFIFGVLRLPLPQFFRAIAEVQGVAFSTSSSNATLPSTINCAQNKLGVDKPVAGSVLPLGATFNMDGTAIYLGLIALFAAQANGVDLTPMHYVMVAVTATLVSIGAAGIPSASLILAATVLKVVEVEGTEALMVIAFIFPFDRLLDMMRTATNVSGDLTVACCVAKWEGVLDEDVFRNPDAGEPDKKADLSKTDTSSASQDS